MPLTSAHINCKVSAQEIGTKQYLPGVFDLLSETLGEGGSWEGWYVPWPSIAVMKRWKFYMMVTNCDEALGNFIMWDGNMRFLMECGRLLLV